MLNTLKFIWNHPISSAKRGAAISRYAALVRDYNESETLLRRYPQLDAEFEDTTDKALEAVAVGRADATVGNIAVLNYKIKELGLKHR